MCDVCGRCHGEIICCETISEAPKGYWTISEPMARWTLFWQRSCLKGRAMEFERCLNAMWTQRVAIWTQSRFNLTSFIGRWRTVQSKVSNMFHWQVQLCAKSVSLKESRQGSCSFFAKVASLCIQMPPLSCVALPPTWSEKVLLLLLVQRVQAISKCEMSGVKNTLQIIRRHCFRAAFAQSAHKAFASICSLWWQFLQNKLVRKTLKNFAVALLYRWTFLHHSRHSRHFRCSFGGISRE